MFDIRLATRRSINNEPAPFQPGQPDLYFGEQSNDLQFNTVNDFDMLSGLEKVRQDINKILLTEVGANINFSLYGTTLQSSIGKKTNFDIIKANIKDQVIGALQVLQLINRSNTNPDERLSILHILDIQLVNYNEIDITVSVLMESGKEISTGVTLSIPTV